MAALKLRRSTRQYSDRPLPAQTLSDLLWAALGINRPSGDRTAPYWRHVMVMDIEATGRAVRDLRADGGISPRVNGTRGWDSTSSVVLATRLIHSDGVPENWQREFGPFTTPCQHPDLRRRSRLKESLP